MSDEAVTNLVREATSLRYARRQILRRAVALGLSAPAIGAVLAATVDAAPRPGAAMAAPAFAKGTKLSILAATYFVPAAQDFYTQQTKQWGSANNVDVSVDYVNLPDLQPKIGAAIQSGSGPDIIEIWDTWPYLYYRSMVDLNDLATKIGQTQGGYYDWVVKTAAVDGHWYSIPHGTSTSAFAYRMSYFKQAGAETFPKTWEELFKVGKQLKAMGKPIGQALGHSLGDPPSLAYPFMWSYGAMEVQADGKTVAFNLPQFVDGMKLFLQGWKDAFDATGLSWDDSANNRAFLADQISATLNGSSIYLKAQTDKPNLAADTNHAPYPAGPAGKFNLLGCHSYGIMSYSGNVDGAKAFLEWWFDPAQYKPWLQAYKGYNIAPGPAYKDDPIFTADPKLAPYADVVNYARNKGYAGPANQAAALSTTKYIVVDTFARAVQSGNAEEAIKWGADQLNSIYNR